jgi:hypothetical protein
VFDVLEEQDFWIVEAKIADGLKADPESARGMMELTVEILVHQHGAKFTRELVLDALDAAQHKSR